MPIRAYCTICSDFFDHARDVSAIHCGHTFHYECLQQWFQTAPTKTCPQCRKQVSTRHIITKLFFDIGGEEDPSAVDPECLRNELDRVTALISAKERDLRDRQKVVESLRATMDKQKVELECVKKEVGEKDMLCSALRKQMKYMENQQNEMMSAKEEARRLRTKMKTYESLGLLLQGQQTEVDAMIADMGVGQSAVEQLSIYCISLKKEYDNLKFNHKASNELCEKFRREVVATTSKLQKTTLEANKAKEDMKALQSDLANADKEISSLKKKLKILQTNLSTGDAISRLVFESPAPLELKEPCLHRPVDSEDIALNITFDVSTPELAEKKRGPEPSKKMRLEEADATPTKLSENSSSRTKRPRAREEDIFVDPFLRNSILFRKKSFGSMLDPQRSRIGAVRTGYDGLGGRTKFIQPTLLSEIRPLALKAKRKKVSRPQPSKLSTLDCFLE